MTISDYPLVSERGRTGSIALERVTQQFLVPREDREFTAVQDVSADVFTPSRSSMRAGPFRRTRS